MQDALLPVACNTASQLRWSFTAQNNHAVLAIDTSKPRSRFALLEERNI